MNSRRPLEPPAMTLARLASPAGRAQLSFALETEFPGWLVHFREAPKLEAAWPVAAFSLTPSNVVDETITPNILSGALTPGAGPQETGLAWRLAQKLDRAMKGSSCLLLVDRGAGHTLRAGGLHRSLELLAEGREPSSIQWKQTEDVPRHFGPGPGVGLQAFAQAFEARVCAQTLGDQAPPRDAPSALPRTRL